jgi:hypothetical protein
MRTEAEIERRLEEIKTLKEKVADITGHGIPMVLTIYEEALLWVLEKYSLDVHPDDDGGG